MEYKISVIVPIYNSAPFLEICVDSLMKQDLNEIEYIFINDASTDDSLLVLKNTLRKYPNKHSNIINLEKNGGISNARNIGLKYAKGEYVTHCDSDDWIDYKMYSTLYDLASKNDADIATCDFVDEYNSYRIFHSQPYSANMEDNIRRILNGDIFPSLWSSIIKRKLISTHNLSFPKDLNMGEDLLFNIQVYIYANKIIHNDSKFYHYRHSENSVCVRKSRESIDSDIAIAGHIEAFLTEIGCKDHFFSEIQYRKFYSKLALIRDLNNKNNYREWLAIYPETHKHIMKFKKIDLKFRLILWLSANNLLFFARIIQKLIKWQHESFKAVHRFFHLTSI